MVLISKWPCCSLCPGLGEHFMPVWLMLVSHQPWAICKLVELPGMWLLQSGLKDHPCPLGLPSASCATSKLYPLATDLSPGALSRWADEEPKPICRRRPGLVQGQTPEEGAVGALWAVWSSPVLQQAWDISHTIPTAGRASGRDFHPTNSGQV